MHRWHRILVAASALLVFPARGRADGMNVRTIEYGLWSQTVVALESQVGSEGTSLHVLVDDERGTPLPCGEYTLHLDAVSAAALTLGRCDPGTHATELVLVHRSQLFAHDGPVPHPLMAGISATETRTTTVEGGAMTAGSSEVTCSVAVRPYLRDLEHATNVFLTPGRYQLHPIGAGITATPQTVGWVVMGGHASMTIEYEVIDEQTQDVVVRDRATLGCGVSSTLGAAAPSAGDRAARRELLQRAREASNAGRRAEAIDLVQRASALAALTTSPPSEPVQTPRDLSSMVPPRPPEPPPVVEDPTIAACAQAYALGLHEHFFAATGTTDAHVFVGSCVRGMDGPEDVYRITVEERSEATFRIDATFRGEIYVRSTCEDRRREVSCQRSDHDGRASIHTVLAPGTYYIFVDGDHQEDSGSYQLYVNVSPLAHRPHVVAPGSAPSCRGPECSRG